MKAQPKLKVDELFEKWLGEEEAKKLVVEMLESKKKEQQQQEQQQQQQQCEIQEEEVVVEMRSEMHKEKKGKRSDTCENFREKQRACDEGTSQEGRAYEQSISSDATCARSLGCDGACDGDEHPFRRRQEPDAYGPPSRLRVCTTSGGAGDGNTKKRYAVPGSIDSEESDEDAAMMSPSALKRQRDNNTTSSSLSTSCCAPPATSIECDYGTPDMLLKSAATDLQVAALKQMDISDGLGRVDVDVDVDTAAATAAAPGNADRATTTTKDEDKLVNNLNVHEVALDEVPCPLCWSYVQSTIGSETDHAKNASDADDRSYECIPRFHFPGGRPVSQQYKFVLARQLCEMLPSHDNPNAEVDDAGMVRITTDLLGLASFFTPAVIDRIRSSYGHRSCSSSGSGDADSNGGSTGVTREAFQRWFCTATDDLPPLCTCTPETRAFAVLRRDRSRSYLTHDDCLELVRVFVARHPGLAFLSCSVEFQETYAKTIVYRIFYSMNRRLDGRLTRRDLERSDFVESCREVDMSADINSIYSYFSYEHFYVIYCKFWELDDDRDLRVSRDDLARYSDSALTSGIIDRIVGGAPCLRWSSSQDTIGYEEFVYFILSEEDKTTLPAITYWFRCIDVDGDGYITYMEMEQFYAQQIARMGNAKQEVIQFRDILCQLIDMIKPRAPGSFSLSDLHTATTGASSVFYNCLFNLSKFYDFEWRDPVIYRLENIMSDWEKFAGNEYMRLTCSVDDDDDDDMGVQLHLSLSRDDEEHAQMLRV